MSFEQLVGKCNRLKGELAQAYGEPAWHAARVDRLADEILMLERQIAQTAPNRVRAPSTAVSPVDGASGRDVPAAR